MSKQLQFSFEDDEIKEASRENSLYNWCIENDKSILLDEWDYEANEWYIISTWRSRNSK